MTDKAERCDFGSLVSAELTAAKTYYRLAELARVPSMKDLFIRFAESERGHADQLRELVSEEFGENPVIKPTAPEQRLIDGFMKTRSVNKAVAISYLLERLSFKNYVAEAMRAGDEKLEDFFKRLADVEAEHARQLAEILQKSGCPLPAEPENIRAIQW